MNKKEIVKGIISGSTSYAVWRELGDEFDDEVGLIRTIGRIGIKFTAAALAGILTDACIESVYTLIFGKKEEEKEDSVSISDDFFEEDTEEEAAEKEVETDGQ